MRILAGLVLIPLGFAAAILAGGAVLTLANFLSFLTFDQAVWVASAALAATAYQFAGLAVVPVLLAVVVAEVFRYRSPLYWVLVWLAMAITAQALPWLAFGPDRQRFILYAIAGLVGGCVYWLIAGRGLIPAQFRLVNSSRTANVPRTPANR